MTNPHVRDQAKGQYLGEEPQLVEADDGRQKYEYSVRCSDCGVVIGSVRHSAQKANHDPADCGLICGECAAARAAEDAQEQAPEGEG
jgi:hypothetical protein